MRNAVLVAVLALASAASPAVAGLGESFIKGSDTLEIRQGPVEETPTARRINPPIDKLGRGIGNVFTSPLEWPLAIREAKKDKGWARALTVAPVIGIGRFAKRLASGLVDVLTFPVKKPSKALWVKHQSLLMEASARSEWVVGEALATQQELYLTEPVQSP